MILSNAAELYLPHLPKYSNIDHIRSNPWSYLNLSVKRVKIIFPRIRMRNRMKCQPRYRLSLWRIECITPNWKASSLPLCQTSGFQNPCQSAVPDPKSLLGNSLFKVDPVWATCFVNFHIWTLLVGRQMLPLHWSCHIGQQEACERLAAALISTSQNM